MCGYTLEVEEYNYFLTFLYRGLTDKFRLENYFEKLDKRILA